MRITDEDKHFAACGVNYDYVTWDCISCGLQLKSRDKVQYVFAGTSGCCAKQRFSYGVRMGGRCEVLRHCRTCDDYRFIPVTDIDMVPSPDDPNTKHLPWLERRARIKAIEAKGGVHGPSYGPLRGPFHCGKEGCAECAGLPERVS